MFCGVTSSRFWFCCLILKGFVCRIKIPITFLKLYIKCVLTKFVVFPSDSRPSLSKGSVLKDGFSVPTTSECVYTNKHPSTESYVVSPPFSGTKPLSGLRRKNTRPFYLRLDKVVLWSLFYFILYWSSNQSCPFPFYPLFLFSVFISEVTLHLSFF